jgi:hypothetical protein
VMPVSMQARTRSRRSALLQVEAGKASVSFVDGDFDEVIAAGFGERQPLCPAQVAGQGFS